MTIAPRQLPENTILLGLKVVAEGEVRNAAGELVDRPRMEKVEQVEVNLADLKAAIEERNLTDEDLTALGFTHEQIEQIRSDSP